MSDRLPELLALMKANKVTRLRVDGLEVEMHPAAFEAAPASVEPAEPSEVTPFLPPEYVRMPSPDEMQFAAGLLWAKDEEQPEEGS